MSEASSEGKRIFFLDNLKAFIICLMIVFHIAMSYMQYAPDWWYAVDKANQQFSFTVFVTWADIFIMPIMFFISGYFGISSLSRQTAKEFWLSKLVRILIPWVLGVLIFAPLVTYLVFLTRQVPLPFMEYLNKVFFFGPLFSHGHYWFLGSLFYLYIILFIVVKIKPSIKEKLNPSEPGRLFFLFIAVLSYVLTFAAYYMIGGNNDNWSKLWPIFLYQPTRVSLYVIYFFAGVYGWRRQWFTEKGVTFDPTIWIPAFLFTGLFYTGFALFGQAAVESASYLPVKSALHSLFVMASVFGLLALFQAKLDYTNGLLKALSDNSYAMYYSHLGLVMLVVWLLTGFAIPVYIKYLLACVLGLAVTYIVGRILMFLPFFTKKA